MHMKACERNNIKHIGSNDDEEEYEMWGAIFANAKKTTRDLNYISVQLFFVFLWIQFLWECLQSSVL